MVLEPSKHILTLFDALTLANERLMEKDATYQGSRLQKQIENALLRAMARKEARSGFRRIASLPGQQQLFESAKLPQHQEE